ncbi:ATP-binding cassette domain-containing protein [Candidatus Poribacteria bacterium]|nr:ATP-binding cassette domain-containing protein [Candidatus Poribacteria bacterium]
MLEIQNLTKVYDNTIRAVNNLNLTVESGEIFVMLGANGAGKTTTIDLILGFIEPTEGTALINGIDIVKEPLEAKKYVAYVSENVMLYGNFTARQNLDFFTKLGGNKDATKEDYDEAMRRVGLPEEAFKRRVKSFSKGMRQRLGIAIAIMKNAKLVLLDEPTSGLDPRGGAEFLELLQVLKSEEKAIFMSTHDIFRASQIADRLGIMSKGNLVALMERDEIVKADLQEIYMEYVQSYNYDQVGEVAETITEDTDDER